MSQNHQSRLCSFEFVSENSSSLKNISSVKKTQFFLSAVNLVNDESVIRLTSRLPSLSLPGNFFSFDTTFSSTLRTLRSLKRICNHRISSTAHSPICSTQASRFIPQGPRSQPTNEWLEGWNGRR